MNNQRRPGERYIMLTLRFLTHEEFWSHQRIWHGVQQRQTFLSVLVPVLDSAILLQLLVCLKYLWEIRSESYRWLPKMSRVRASCDLQSKFDLPSWWCQKMLSGVSFDWTQSDYRCCKLILQASDQQRWNHTVGYDHSSSEWLFWGSHGHCLPFPEFVDFFY